MVDFKYDFTFLFKMFKFIFLPILALSILVGFIIFIYSRNVKKKDIKKYNYIVDFWTTFIAIWIIGALFAVTVGFSISLTRAMVMYKLVEANQLVYYLILATPLVPLLFLAIYMYRITVILINKPNNETKNQINEEDMVPQPSYVSIDEQSTDKEEIKANFDDNKQENTDLNTFNSDEVQKDNDKEEENSEDISIPIVFYNQETEEVKNEIPVENKQDNNFIDDGFEDDKSDFIISTIGSMNDSHQETKYDEEDNIEIL